MADAPKRQIQQLAPQIGLMTILWAEIHFYVLIIFVRLLKDDFLAAEPIFFALRSDAAQRSITRSLASQKLEQWADLKARTLAAIDGIARLAEHRNKVIHAMWIIDRSDLTVGKWDILNEVPDKLTFDERFEAFMREGQLMITELTEVSTDVQNAMTGKPTQQGLLSALLLTPPPPHNPLPPTEGEENQKQACVSDPEPPRS